MRRYFFDTSIGNGAAGIDAEGELLPDDGAARQMALRRFPGFGDDPPADLEYRTRAVTVRDQAGVVVCRLVWALFADDIQRSG